MRRGGRILILLGLVLGLITAVAAFAVLSQSRSQAGAVQVKTVRVVIAQQNIPLHAPIPASALTLYEWPEDMQLPRNTYTDISQVSGKLTKTPIAIGQLVSADMVVDKKAEETRKGLGSDAALIIPAGKVAVAFPLNQISGVAGALKDGDTVDLLVSYDLVSGNQVATGVTKRQVTQITLQDVEILRVGAWSAATNANNDTGRGDASVMTFLVNRQDALVLKFLRETTTEVQMVLRAAGDHEIVKTEPVIIDYVDGRFGFTGMLNGKLTK
jgi:pilus assembly protein CpaB